MKVGHWVPIIGATIAFILVAAAAGAYFLAQSDIRNSVGPIGQTKALSIHYDGIGVGLPPRIRFELQVDGVTVMHADWHLWPFRALRNATP